MITSSNWGTRPHVIGRKPNVLFVCTGNINRSAAAEFIAQRMFPDDWNVYSVALNGTSGHPMHPRMREILQLPIEAHRSRALQPYNLVWADVVVGFQPSHCNAFNKFMDEWNFADPSPIWASMVYWLQDENVNKVLDPNFDSTGKSHKEVVRLLDKAIPRMHAEICLTPS